MPLYLVGPSLCNNPQFIIDFTYPNTEWILTHVIAFETLLVGTKDLAVMQQTLKLPLYTNSYYIGASPHDRYTKLMLPSILVG